MCSFACRSELLYINIDIKRENNWNFFTHKSKCSLSPLTTYIESHITVDSFHESVCPTVSMSKPSEPFATQPRKTKPSPASVFCGVNCKDVSPPSTTQRLAVIATATLFARHTKRRSSTATSRAPSQAARPRSAEKKKSLSKAFQARPP